MTEEISHQFILTRTEGRVGLIQLNRPKVLNALNREIMGEVIAALEAFDEQEAIGVIVLTGNNYQSQTEYLFTRLNEVKPAMIEDATRKAREVAEKFAEDSDSRLGKIRRASQGQFSISPRDNNTPHIKKVRVVSTIEYYLSD